MTKVRKLKNYVNGKWVASKTEKYENVINPATGEILCQVPISTRAELQRGIENVEFAAGAPTLMMGDSLASIATDVEAANYRYPVGVVGGIAPFNFPMMVPCWMFPIAIALGNSFILKPSEG